MIESTADTMKRFGYIAGRIKSVEDAVKHEAEATPDYLQFWNQIRYQLQEIRKDLVEQIRYNEVGKE